MTEPAKDPIEQPKSGGENTTGGGDIRLPAAPVLVISGTHALWLSEDGEIEEVSLEETASRVQSVTPILVHRLAIARKLKINPFNAYDLLELFAFTYPARACLPTTSGLIKAVGLSCPTNAEDQTLALYDAARLILQQMFDFSPTMRTSASRIAMTMSEAGWNWGPSVLAALGMPNASGPLGGLDVWKQLKDWPDFAPEPPPDDIPVSEMEARQRLKELLGDGAEERPQQSDYSAAASKAFTPRQQIDAPNIVLAEAGTGVGKTLGYIAPASLWAEKNGGTVWISTFTKNLQRQIDGELDRLYPDAAEKQQKAVLRKGRENYLCLLNYEEALMGGASLGGDRIILGIVARWLLASRDGDMIGGDFPAWLPQLAGSGRITRLADRRGECIYSACPHYRKCYIEKSHRKARKADIVIANHALVMINAATREGDMSLPKRYVFDEGHHIFEAADSAFSAHLSGQETTELRRWIAGNDSRRSSRMRGLEKRIGDLIGEDEAAQEALHDAVRAARKLPAEGWIKRLQDGTPTGPVEAFLLHIRAQVLARSNQPDSPYSIECPTNEPLADLEATAADLQKSLGQLEKPLKLLSKYLLARLEDEAEDLDSATRSRIEAAVSNLDRRVNMVISPWRNMLTSLKEDAPEQFVDWFGIDRSGGRDVDLGYYRSWIDPTIPFAEILLKQSHGSLITSATLRDGSLEDEESWLSAETRTGAHHLPLPAIRAYLTSPFDYANQTRVIVITDVRRDHLREIASAYRELILAAKGGALGLFTAIWRLRAVHEQLVTPMSDAGIELLAQHQDALDTSTLIDIFKEEEDSVLLGTDAVRDGVDVPGRALRLILFDRVPWPRPDLKHKARKKMFGGSKYDDRLTRLKLKQAFGRLVRRKSDFGVFVMLDSMMPSRLASAFPPEVEIHRLGLKDAISLTRNFIAEKDRSPAAFSLDKRS